MEEEQVLDPHESTTLSNTTEETVDDACCEV